MTIASPRHRVKATKTGTRWASRSKSLPRWPKWLLAIFQPLAAIVVGGCVIHVVSLLIA